MSHPLLPRHLEGLIADVPRWMSRVAHEARQALHAPTSTLTLRGLGGGPLFDAEVALARHHPLWSRRVAELLAERWRAELDAPGSPAAQRAARGASLGELRLVDEAQAEEAIEQLRLIQALAATHEGLLSELQARYATLRGQTAVQRQANLLRPERLVHAVWDGSEALGLHGPARVALLRAAAEPLLQALGEVLAASLAELSQAGVDAAPWQAPVHPPRLPDGPPPSGYDLTRPGAIDALRDRVEPQVGSVSVDAAASPQQLDALLRHVLDGHGPDGLPILDLSLDWDPDGQPVAVMPSPAPAPAVPADRPINLLLQRLPQLEASARHRADRQVIELVAHLVEALLTDAQLRLPVRQVLASLQGPLLRIAVAEPRLFDDHRHPAWQLINRIGAHTLGFEQDEDPRLLRALDGMQAACQRLARADRPDHAAQTAALSLLQQACENELEAERDDSALALQRIEHIIRREAIETPARRQIQARLLEAAQVADLHLEPALRSFLTGPWARAIAEAALLDGERSTLCQALRGVVGELLDSLEPPRHDADRERLRRALPGLVQRLQRGCQLAEVPAVQRDAVFETLMTRHARFMRPRAAAAAEPPPGSELPAEALPTPPDAPPAVVLHAEPPRRAEPLFDLGSLVTVPAALMDEPHPQAAPRDWLRRLAPGDWCRLVARGQWTVARVLWVSPQREHWLFTDAEPGLRHAFTRRALERLVSEQLAGPLEARSLLERAVDAMLARTAEA